MRKAVYPSNAPRPGGQYSPAIVCDGWVYVAGQGPTNPETGKLELGDIQDEVRRTLTNVRNILEAAGSSLANVVRVGVFLGDMKDFDAMNAVYKEFFPEVPPARTTVGVHLPQIKVEIDCIARVKQKRRIKK